MSAVAAPDPSFAAAAGDARLARTASALTARGFVVEVLDNAAEARARVRELLPEGSAVLTAASETLRLSGIEADINTSGRYRAIRPRVTSMDRITAADEIRRLTAAPEAVVGSVAAVTETGALLAASASGSQIPAYAGGSCWCGRPSASDKEMPNMSRIPTHTLASAPPAARPLLEEVVTLAGGRLLNLHTSLANSPALLASYLGMRRALTEHRTLDPKTGAAVMLTVSAATGGAYSLAVNSQVAMRAGFSAGEVEELRSGSWSDGRLTALLAVAREAATGGGRVSDATWHAARAAGWNEAQLAEAFAFIGLAVYVDFYNNYAGTELDVASTRGQED